MKLRQYHYSDEEIKNLNPYRLYALYNIVRLIDLENLFDFLNILLISNISDYNKFKESINSYESKIEDIYLRYDYGSNLEEYEKYVDDQYKRFLNFFGLRQEENGRDQRT